MSKRDEIDYLLSLVQIQINEFLEAELQHGLELEAQDLIVAAIESVLSQPVTRIEYGTPIATVDRSSMSFMIDEERALPVYGEDYDED